MLPLLLPLDLNWLCTMQLQLSASAAQMCVCPSAVQMSCSADNKKVASNCKQLVNMQSSSSIDRWSAMLNANLSPSFLLASAPSQAYPIQIEWNDRGVTTNCPVVLMAASVGKWHCQAVPFLPLLADKSSRNSRHLHLII